MADDLEQQPAGGGESSVDELERQRELYQEEREAQRQQEEASQPSLRQQVQQATRQLGQQEAQRAVQQVGKQATRAAARAGASLFWRGVVFLFTTPWGWVILGVIAGLALITFIILFVVGLAQEDVSLQLVEDEGLGGVIDIIRSAF